MAEVYLSRLYYASTATDQYSPMEIGNILESCRKNNPPLDITGVLFLGNDYFFQCLEGPRQNVNTLYKQILADPRHTDVQLLEFKEVGSRFFSEWSMKYIRSMTVVNRILKETGVNTFNPYQLDNYVINAIAEAFRDYQESDAAAVNVQSAKDKKSGFFNFLKR